MLSGGVIINLVLFVSVCLCCKILSLCRLHTISVGTMVCDRPVLRLTYLSLSSPPLVGFRCTHMCAWDTLGIVVCAEYGFLVGGVNGDGGGGKA